MKHIKILSDYSPADSPNFLNIVYDEQGDIHIWTYCRENDDKTIRLANSGTRHRTRNSHKIWKAFQELIKAYEAELRDPDCHPDLREINGLPAYQSKEG